MNFLMSGPGQQTAGGLEQRPSGPRDQGGFCQVAAQFIGQHRPWPNQHANLLLKLLFAVLGRNFEHRGGFVIRVGGVLNSLLVN